MGIETSAEHGGAESSFTSAIIVIEELAKVDPSVSVMCDVHNTLVNTIVRKHGTKEQQDQFMPLLAESKVWPHLTSVLNVIIMIHSSALSVYPNLHLVLMRSHYKHEPGEKGIIGSSMAPRCGSQTHTRPTSSLSLPTSVSLSLQSTCAYSEKGGPEQRLQRHNLFHSYQRHGYSDCQEGTEAGHQSLLHMYSQFR